MEITLKEMGNQINHQLDKKFDINNLAKLMYQFFHAKINGPMSEGVEELLDRLISINLGPGYDYTEFEIRQIAFYFCTENLAALDFVLNKIKELENHAEKQTEYKIKNSIPFETNLTRDLTLKSNPISKLIGISLNQELEKSYDISRLVNWANNLFMTQNGIFPTKEIKDIINRLGVMEAGPEYVFSELELREIAFKLIVGDFEYFKILSADTLHPKI